MATCDVCGEKKGTIRSSFGPVLCPAHWEVACHKCGRQFGASASASELATHYCDDVETCRPKTETSRPEKAPNLMDKFVNWEIRRKFRSLEKAPIGSTRTVSPRASYRWLYEPLGWDCIEHRHVQVQGMRQTDIDIYAKRRRVDPEEVAALKRQLGMAQEGHETVT